MLHHRLLIQLLHLPAQQTPQLGADDFLLCCRCFGVRDSSVIACRCGLFAIRRCWLGWAFRSGRLALPYAGSGEALLAVDGFDRALKAAEEFLSAEKG